MAGAGPHDPSGHDRELTWPRAECLQSPVMSTAHISCPARRRPVHGLDVVRLIAAMLVVIYHLGFKAWALPGSSLRHVIDAPVPHPPGYGFTWCGWIGVQVFFVVSGAVIAYSAEGARPGSFARRRLARLLPAILIATPLALPLAALLFRTPPAAALMLGLKTVAFAPVGPWIMGQFWTIPIELAFYAPVWAILASGMPERGLRALPWGLGLASAGYWFGAAFGGLQPGGRLAELLLVSHGVYFALGMLCARLGTGTLAHRHGLLALVCAGAAAVQVRTTAGWEMGSRAELSAQWLVPYAVWFILAAAVGASFRWRSATELRVARHAKGLRMAGMTTYPLYLTHIHTGGAALAACSALGVLAASVLACLVSLLVAWSIALHLEPHVHVTVDRVLKDIAMRAKGAVQAG